MPSVIVKELHMGEKVLWVGKPKQGFVLYNIPKSLFGCFFLYMSGSFIFAALYNVITEPDFVLKLLFAVPILAFLLFLLYVIFGCLLHDMYLRKYLVYAVTNERILIIPQIFEHYPKRLDIRSYATDLIMKNESEGTIKFRRRSWSPEAFFGFDQYPFLTRPWGIALCQPARFAGIKNAKYVHELIQKQQ